VNPKINISPIVPEARVTVLAAAQVYWMHTRPWFIGLLIHGSALKGGFIPGCSDIDFKLYLRDTAFEQNGRLPLELCLAVQRDLAKIDPAPFQYIQCYAHPHPPIPNEQKKESGPIPGAYYMLLGELPVSEATPEEVRDGAKSYLADLKPVPFYITNTLLQHGGDKLARNVRLLCTDVWPTLYNLLTVKEHNPLTVWHHPKEKAIALMPSEEPCGSTIRLFYQSIRAYYQSGLPVEKALEAIQHGTSFLKAAKDWFIHESNIRNDIE